MKYKNAINAPSILMDMMVTSYFPKMIHATVRHAIEMIPKPDSIPLRPASMFVRLDPIDNAIGIVIRYNKPTLGGAAQINGRPAMNSKKNFVFDERLGERVTNDVIAKCHQCGELSDRHTNCANQECHDLVIQCEKCAEEFVGCCSEKCMTVLLNKTEVESLA